MAQSPLPASHNAACLPTAGSLSSRSESSQSSREAMSGDEDGERSSQAHDELARKLRAVGLDEVYWKQKLREVLLISSAQALPQLDRQECKELDSHFRKSWEKKAFYKMLAICDADDVVHDEEVMSLAPQTQNENMLPSVVSEKMNEPAQATGNNISSHCVSDEDILQNASGGLALEGVYMGGKLQDKLEKRGKLLTIPQTFRFVEPVHTPMTQQHEFISFGEESVFKKSMEVMGFSSTASGQGRVSALSRNPISMQTKSLNRKEMQYIQPDHSYISRTEYTYLPLASGHLQMAQLRLSDAALKELQNIEDTVESTKDEFKSTRLTSVIRSFFHKFGSHANEGPLEFGGMFWRKASAKGFSSDQRDEMKRLLSESLGSSIGADCESRTTPDTGTVMATETTAGGSDQHSAVLTDMMQMTVTTIGGDPDVHDLPQWKADLVSNNGTWSLIDRGIRFIPVWEIVLSNHKCDFKDALKVASDLITAYTILTNKHANKYPDDPLAATIAEAQSIMQDVTQWMRSDDVTPLDKLWNLKQKLYECAQTNRSWIDACLSHPALQEYLKFVVWTCRQSSGDDSKLMKIQSLLEPNVYAVENFPQRSSIMRLVYGTDTGRVHDAELQALAKTFTETKKRLKEVTDSATYSETALNVAKVKATNDVAFALNSLCRCLREMKQVQEEELLLSAAAAGFSETERLFHRLLDYKDVDCLQQEVDRARSEYSALRSQIAPEDTGAQANARNSEEKKEKRLTSMGSHLDATVHTDVSKVEQGHEEIPIHCEQTEESLKSPVAVTALAVSQTREVESEANETERFMDLLDRLDLKKYYPKIMHTGDVCVVDSALCTKHPSTEQELAPYFVQKLITGDYQARYVSVRSENKINETMHNDADTNYEDFFEHDDTLSCRDGLAANTQTHIHPMDLQMAFLQCGDNFVRQYIYTKLSFCQFALPLLVPNPRSSEIEFPLWAFRQINKSWKCRDTFTKTQQTKTCAIVNADTPLVSFIRLGESPTSKSQMLNSLLSQQKHGVFFNRHCEGSGRNCLLMEGVTEVAWYCPGGRDDDVFDDCIAFTNLHGDARRHRRQVQFLHEISTINVILMSDRDLNDEAKIILQECLKTPTPLVCLWADKETIGGGHSRTKVKIAVKNRNEAGLIKELKSTLNNLLANSTQTINLDDCSNIARRHGFTVDEDDEDCKEGKSMADVLLSLLKDKPLSSMKETFLPLQGQLWHEWCKRDKELTRLRVKENQSIEQYRDNIEMEKQSIRRAQRLKAFPVNDVMRTLTEVLEHQADKVKKYFLHWLKIYLDRLSAECLPQLHQQYHQARREMLKLKKETMHESSLLDKKQAELNKISQKRDACSFGIDHLFREVGQIYEASQTSRGADKRSAALPGIAADLMLFGFPLELMDGEASHVPLSWISSVLDQVTEKIGDKTLFVLSILSLQSSGKSTLLNAMFGLQFPVGAGRCTRGVYMQLVKVEEEFSTELGYDFVLIVDTEGLRAPELSNSSPTRDNELATFVIGLGNATVINIFGENPSEMQDILQIAVQAFLRMKRVKLSPSCVFVHQNVGDVTTQDKNVEGRRRLQEKLDEMTRLAAQQEQSTVESFDEVIRFDVDSHIRYFANLWEGNPPMAPTNPLYCQNVQDLKEMLLSIAKTEHKVLKISEFKARTQDLWKALLAENFVFSFKNTLEIAAYSKLEAMYGRWTWSLRSYLIQEENKQHSIINNSKDTTYGLTRFSVEQRVLPKYNEISKQIETYFNADDAEWLSQWKANFVKRFEAIKDELVNDTYKKCIDLTKQNKYWIELDQNRSRYEDQLIKKSKDLATKLKTTGLKDVQLKEEFNKMWEEWTHDVKKSITPSRKVNFRQLAQEVLREHFECQTNLLAKFIKMQANELFMFLPQEHVVIKREGVWNKVKNQVSYINRQEIDIVKKITKDAENAAMEILKALEKRKLGYSKTNIHQVLHTVQTAVDAGVVAVVNDNASKGTATMRLTNRYRLDLSIHILANAEGRFQKIENDFQTPSDPLIYLNSKKEDYFLTFKNRCEGATNTTIFADILCRELKTALHQAVCDKASIDIASKIKSNCRAINGNRSNLENYIMIHLAEIEDFAKFTEYIQKPKTYFEHYIKERVEEYCSEEKNKNIREIFQSCLDLHKNDVFNAITNATTAVHNSKGDVSSWLNEFSKQLCNKIHVPRHSLDEADYKDIDDIGYFREELTASMTTTVAKLNEQFSKASLTDLEDVRNTPHGMLCEQMSGCWVQCPFCEATCTNTMPNHDGDHSVQIHRSQAVTGWCTIGTDTFVPDVCTSLVASNCRFVASEDNYIPYKDYRTGGPEYARWSITPDLSVQPYWKWFVCRFKSDLERLHGLQFKDSGAIPEGWKTITKQGVIADLQKK